jgi:hypothetical protein
VIARRQEQRHHQRRLPALRYRRLRHHAEDGRLARSRCRWWRRSARRPCPQDVSAAENSAVVAFLCSTRAGYITGERANRHGGYPGSL